MRQIDLSAALLDALKALEKRRQEQLGHSSSKLRVDTYTHWVPGKNREAMDRLPVLASKAR